MGYIANHNMYRSLWITMSIRRSTVTVFQKCNNLLKFVQFGYVITECSGKKYTQYDVMHSNLEHDIT